MQLDNLYQEVILDHYKNPQNKHLESDNDAQVHHVNPSCGDEVTLGVKLAGDKVESINCCLLYTSPSPRDLSTSRMPSSA